MAPNHPNYTAIDQILRRMPTTTFTPPQVMLPTEAMGDSGEFTGRWIVGFQYQDFSKTVESWVDMVVALIQHLLRDHRSELLALSNDAALLHLSLIHI